jgi:hypothetical protein
VWGLSSDELDFPLVFPLPLQPPHSNPPTPTLPSSLPFPLHYSRMLSSGCMGMGDECEESHEMSITNITLSSSIGTRR